MREVKNLLFFNFSGGSKDEENVIRKSKLHLLFVRESQVHRLLRILQNTWTILTVLVIWTLASDWLEAQEHPKLTRGRFMVDEKGHLGDWLLENQSVLEQDRLKKSQLAQIEQHGVIFKKKYSKLKWPEHVPYEDNWGNEPPEVSERKERERERASKEHSRKYYQLCDEYHQGSLSVLSDSQKRRVIQALVQLEGASAGWPFFYFKRKDFINAAKLNESQQKAFNKYLMDVALGDFTERVNKLIQKHRTQALSVLSDKTRKNLVELVGEQRPVKFIPIIRIEMMMRHSHLHELDDRMLTKPINERQYQAWGRLLANAFVIKDLEWLDEQHKKHIQIVSECRMKYRVIPRPTGPEYRLGPHTTKTILDKADVEAYKKKVSDNYKAYHEQRMSLLLPHQKKRLFQSLRQCARMKESVLAYLGEERLLTLAKATDEEKQKIRKVIKKEAKTMRQTFQKMIAQQTEAIYQQLPEDKRKKLEETFGEPLYFIAVPEIVYSNYYIGTPIYRELLKAFHQ